MINDTRLIQSFVHHSVAFNKMRFNGTQIEKDEKNPFQNLDLKDLTFSDKFACYILYKIDPKSELQEKAPKSRLYQWLINKKYALEEMDYNPLAFLYCGILATRILVWMIIGTRKLALALAHLKLPDEDPTLPNPPASYEDYQKLNLFEKGLYRYYFKQPIPVMTTS